MTTIDSVGRDLTARLGARSGAPAGGFNLTLLGLELRRVLSNKRTMIFTLVFPAVMFLFVAAQVPASEQKMGSAVANVGAYIMVSMAVYGAIMATTSAGASVSIERASGWSRQLRLTPLRPLAYIVLKLLAALTMGVIATVVTFVVGDVTGKAQMATGTWIEAGAIIIVGSLVFAAFGLFLGYLLPSDNAMQFIGPILAIFSIFGGLFSGPIDESSTYGQIAHLTPIYGLSQIAHWPLTLTTAGAYDTFHVSWMLNLAGWAVIFIGGAVWRFRRDTARV